MVPSPTPPDDVSVPSVEEGTLAPPARVEWAHHHGTVRWLRWLTYAVAGVLGGLLLLLYLGVFAMLVLVFLGGSLEMRALVVLLALVGGPFSLLYLLPMVADPDQRPTFAPETHRVGPRLDRPRLVAAVVLGAFAVGVAGLAGIEFAFALVVAGLLAGALATTCTTQGTLDGDDLTLTTRGVTRSLDRVAGVARYGLGPLVLFRLKPERGPGSLSAPRFVVVPVGVADDAERVLERATTAEHDGRDPNPAVRIAAAALGTLFLAAAVAVVVFVPDLSLGVFILGLFAVILFAVAVLEG